MSRTEKKFGKFMLLTVVGVGLIGLLAQLMDPLSDPASFKSGVLNSLDVQSLPLSSENKLNDLNTESQREPASESSSPQSNFNFKCDSNPSYDTRLNRVRIFGDVCSTNPEKEATGDFIENSTNHFVATIFHPGKGKFATDLINLNEGENKIVLKFSFGEEVVEKSLNIVRAPAADSKK